MPSITDLGTLSGTPASNDWTAITDVSDTSQSPEGTSKKISVGDYMGSLVNQKSRIDELHPPYSGVQARGFGYQESTDAGTRKPLMKLWTFDDTTAEAAIGEFVPPQV